MSLCICVAASGEVCHCVSVLQQVEEKCVIVCLCCRKLRRSVSLCVCVAASGGEVCHCASVLQQVEEKCVIVCLCCSNWRRSVSLCVCVAASGGEVCIPTK